MDHLWSPWRYQYVQKARTSAGCIFCEKAAEQRDAENFLVYRGKHNFILLNLYPYTTGHLMIVPYEHVDTLERASRESLDEMMLLAQRAQGCLGAIYKPAGFNIGMNLGESAGAGIADHIHMHVLPRWPGDTSFITTVGETRVLPEELVVTYRKLSEAFRG
ncbi:MAG TPA: HIT domain-containing protein [Bryobacteraceae bacterium]|nr:HIT domain-containing protein [Bryobacteraceae bacterium]